MAVPLDGQIGINIKDIDLAAMLVRAHSTLGCRGTPVGHRCSRNIEFTCIGIDPILIGLDSGKTKAHLINRVENINVIN